MPICSRSPGCCHCQLLSPHSLEDLTWAHGLLISLGMVTIITAVLTPALHCAGKRWPCSSQCCPCGDEMLEEMSCMLWGLEPFQGFLGCSGGWDQPQQLFSVLGYNMP